MSIKSWRESLRDGIPFGNQVTYVCETNPFTGHGLFRRNAGVDLCLFDAVWDVSSFIPPPRGGPFTVDRFNEYASSLPGEGEESVRLDFVGGRTFLHGSYVFYYSLDLIGGHGRFFGVIVGIDGKSVVFCGEELFPFEINTDVFLDAFFTRPKASVFALVNGDGLIDRSAWQLSLSGGAESLIEREIQTKRTICLKCSGSLCKRVYDIQAKIRWVAA